MLHTVSLGLARSHEHPEGSTRHGYEMTAPLDAEEWRDARDRCRVRRLWAGELDRHGRLVHRAGGARWIIDYDDRSTADDEAGYRLDTHRFVKGEYVSIRDDDGELHTFLVTDVGQA